jgi:hypothetical protein
MALDAQTKSFVTNKFSAYAGKLDSLSSIPGFDSELERGFDVFKQGMSGGGGNFVSGGLSIMNKTLSGASSDPVAFVKSAMRDAIYNGKPDLLRSEVQYLANNNVSIDDIKSIATGYATQKAEGDAAYAAAQQGGGGLFGGITDFLASIDPSTAISKAATDLFQPVEQAVTTNLAQLDKDLSLSQNAPLIATIAATIALPGVGASIGNSLLSAGLLPVGTSVATATAVGSGLANAALQVAQGKSPEDALKAGVVGVAGGAIGSYLVGDPGTLKNFVTSTSTNLLAGKNPEDAVIAGIASSGAGLAGRTVASETGSAAAGQVAAGTTAGLLTGKTAEQSLAQGVGNIKLDSLIPDSGVTVANQAQVLAGQQDLQNQLAPFQVDTTASSFDTKDIIDDSSGFSTTTTAPAIIDSGVINPAQTVANVVGTDATQIDTTQTAVNTGVKTMGEDDEVIDYEGAGMSAGLSEYLADPEGATMYADIQRELNLDPEGATMSAGLSQAIQDYSTGTGLTVKDVVKFFKANPNLAKAATSVISGGVGLFGTKLATDTAREAARVAAEAQKFKPVGVTTRFGTTDYKYDADNNLVSAGYTLTPDLKAIQDKLMSGATLSLDEAKKVSDLYDPLKKASTSLFDLGTSYLAKTPEQVAADYMAKQQDLLAPSRERQMSQLQNTLFQQGRGGLSVGATSARPSGARGLGATTPEMEAYYNALAQQDAALAAGAQQAGQQSVLFGKGLLGAGGEFLGKYTAGQTGAYDPFKSLLASAGTVESMGAGALDVGTALGGRRTTAASNAASTLLPTASVNPYSSLFTSLADDPSFKTALQEFISGGSSGTNYGTASRANDVNTPF